MIPKIIHYCWFGGKPHPPLVKKCIASWKKHCPHFEIMEWSEENFDVNICSYAREAYAAKKWAFVSDYARLWALYNFGGIYMDTDCELIKPIDRFLEHEAVSGFESPNEIPTALMGCRKGFPLFKELIERYHTRNFAKQDGSYDFTTNVADITAVCLANGLVLNNTKQTIRGFTLYPRDWFCPVDWQTHKMVALTENTHAIHHFNASWQTWRMKLLSVFYVLPNPVKDILRRIWRCFRND